MSRNRTSFFEAVIRAPWWVSVAIFIFGNIAIREGIPAWFSGERTPGDVGVMLSGGMAQAAPFIANMFSLVFGVAMIIACVRDFLEYRKQKVN